MAKAQGRGKYEATPVTVTFPADLPNEKLAGKTVTYAGRGRKPTWWDLAVELELVKVEEKAAAKTDEAAGDTSASAQA